MNRKRMFIILAGIILLVSLNLFLIFKDNSKVSRSLYITNWEKVKEQTISEKMKTEGVTAPIEEQEIYYDSQQGSFESFAVKQGEEVQSGDTLFYYSTDAYDADISSLESERDRLQRQTEALETKLTDLEGLQDVTDLDKSTKNVSVQMEIYQTEAEIKKLESDIDKYDERISAIDEKLPSLQEISDIDGIVKNVHHNLSNPIMTIASNELTVKGILSEKEQAKTSSGMDANVFVKNKSYKGSVQQVAKYPEEDPSVKKESHYPFTIVFDKPVENLAYGTHVQVNITTKIATNVIAIPKNNILKDGKSKWVYVLNNGTIKKQEVITGLQVNSKQEIRKGLSAGEAIALQRIKTASKSPTFFTPLKVEKWDRNMYSNMRKRDMVINAAKGFLSF